MTERDVLAEAIAHAAEKRGIIARDAELTSAQLVMLCADLATLPEADADGVRYRWLTANPSWSMRWRIHPKKQVEQWQMVDNGESWGQWGDHREVLDRARIQSQQSGGGGK